MPKLRHQLICSGCHGPNDRPKHGYCRSCHIAYVRHWNANRTKQFHDMRETILSQASEIRQLRERIAELESTTKGSRR